MRRLTGHPARANIFPIVEISCNQASQSDLAQKPRTGTGKNPAFSAFAKHRSYGGVVTGWVRKSLEIKFREQVEEEGWVDTAFKNSMEDTSNKLDCLQEEKVEWVRNQVCAALEVIVRVPPTFIPIQNSRQVMVC